MRRIVLSLLLAIILALTLVACSAPAELTIEQLMASPEKYNGDMVVVSGFYFHGFETIVLCESLKYSGNVENHMVPEGKFLWIEGGIPREVYDTLYIQSEMGPEERYGKIKVKGKFDTGGQFGHLGAFDSQILPQQVELLPWTPPGSD